MSWQPIETAPKDGTRIILFSMEDGGDGIVTVGYWAGPSEDGAKWGWRLKGEYLRPRAVSAEMWQPLPQPPRVEWHYTIAVD